MEENNMAISAELISLRGGLSLISKYTDEIKKCQNNNSEARIETQQKEENVKRKAEVYRQAKTEVLNQEKYCAKIRAEYKECEALPADKLFVDYVKRPFKPKYSDDSAIKWGWILGIVTGVLIFLIFLDDTFYSAIPGFWAIPISNYALFRPIIHVIRCVIFARQIATYKENVLNFINEKLKDAEKVLEEKRHAENVANTNRINAEKELSDQRKKEAETIKANSEIIESLAAKSNAVNESLRESYGKVIMECDWHNIDLILYYFETGRADNLKEALQQVDRQRQTNQITAAIHSASMSLSAHLESAFSRMGEALAVCFNKLNRNIQDATNRIESQLITSQRNSSETNNALLDRLDKQISVSEIQNMLIEKANKTSDELLNDLRYNQQFWRK